MEFVKMHGLGNDYVYVDCFSQKVEEPSALAVRISDRHTGIGSDGLILICPSETADVRMRMFNADGSEAQMCGNGIRCLAKYAYDYGLAGGDVEFSVPGQATFDYSIRVETGRGILTVGLAIGADDRVVRACVNMGQPILEASRIPVLIGGAEPVVEAPFDVNARELNMTCVSMGNPHAVFFCENPADINLEKDGPAVENHPAFPERTNVHFVKPLGPKEFSMRTWERGSGITLACGTGACAALVAGVLTGRLDRVAVGHLPGGKLELNWSGEDNCVYMTGPAVEVFRGTWPD